MIKKRDQVEKERKKVSHKEQKPYSKPQLKEYGYVEKLTQSGGTRPKEGLARRLP